MTPAVIQITPDPIAFSFGPLSIGWYGIAYVIALGVLILVTQRMAAARGFDPSHVGNAFLLVLPFAVVGGRLYHVIHEWGACGVGDPCYSQNLARIVLPPYAGLGLYGGVAGAAIAILIYSRWKKLPLAIALDAVIPGTLFAQGIARWGNFFNQELYGPPTDSPWGIAIDCAHRIAPWFCPADPRLAAGAAGYPLDTGFHPLFFYESALDILGGVIALYVGMRFLRQLKPLDLGAFWMIWYGSIRAFLETFREGWNWTVGGVATAQWIGLIIIVIGLGIIAWNHRPGSQPYPYLSPWQPPAPVPMPTADDEADYYAPSELDRATGPDEVAEADDEEWAEVDDEGPGADDEGSGPDDEGSGPDHEPAEAEAETRP